MVRWLLCLSLYTILTVKAQATDTLFVRSIEIPGRVRNIDFDGRNLLVRCENACYLYQNGKTKKLDIPLQGRFSWFVKSYENATSTIYHTDYIFPEKLVQKGMLDNILPGFYTNNITCVTIENALFVAYRGVLLEFVLANDIIFSHQGQSIRHIYTNDSIQIISSYSGIYMSKADLFKDRILKGTTYSNGELSEIEGQYYLCQDGLYTLKGDTSLIQVGFGVDNSAFRKLIVWNGKIVSLFNTHVSLYNLDSFTEISTLASGAEFNDVEVFENDLLCSTSSGLVIKIRPDGTKDTIKINGAIHDLMIRDKEIIASSDSGLYIINRSLEPTPITTHLPALQTIAYGPNLFISTLDGLYLLRDGIFHTLIPNVEFNKHGLSIFNNFLYAGSVDGLYTIQLTHFDSKILPTLSPYIIALEPSPMPLSRILGIGLLMALVTGVMVYYFIKRKKLLQNAMPPAPVFSMEMVMQTIRENDEIISVKALSEKLDISVVQLNRKLKPYGETPLSLMQKVKKELALEMHNKGLSLEEIVKRTGYSKRYIREHFFN